ncbi:MAG TPA: HAD family hydrolase [Candidatus Kryptonia bacterium]|nr:HAD family hydrolase [Candidatus Kryptonia bacterium]
MNGLPGVVLLDLDDTIVRFSAAGDECWDVLCSQFAPRLGVRTPDLRAAVDRSAQAYWSDAERHRVGRLDLRATRRVIVRTALGDLGVADDEIAQELADRFTVEREERVRPFPGAVETLRHLRDHGQRLGLLTNGSSEFQRRKIERFDLGRFFDVILIEGDLGFGKPDHRVFQRALDELGAAPADAWMIGDNLEWDIEPAQQLGILDVWVDHAGSGLPLTSSIAPTHTITGLAALADIIG